MRVVVTGSNGFVGRHLTAALLAEPGIGSQRIDRLVLLDREPSPFEDARIVSVSGDLCDPGCRAEALAGGADCIFHLAAVPGGLAERQPDLSVRINLEATLALVDQAAALGARFVYASTIAVLGAPTSVVSDETEPEPLTVYGRHKRRIERMLQERFASQGLAAASLRLPGLVARPPGDTALKSAFLSDIFHALAAGKVFTAPVSPRATTWLMSIDQATANLVHASQPETIQALGGIPVTLPALRTSMADLASAIAGAFGVPENLVRYQADDGLEHLFGRLPPLETPAAEAAGLRSDATLETLVARVVAQIVSARP